MIVHLVFEAQARKGKNSHIPAQNDGELSQDTIKKYERDPKSHEKQRSPEIYR
jgi:hypothetical protein